MFQILGAIAAIAVAAGLLRWLWRHRTPIFGWVRSRSRGLQVALVLVGVFGVVLVSVLGASGYNYTQHDNEFCMSCHVMDTAFTRF